MLIKNQLKNVKGIFARNTPDVVFIIKDMIDMKQTLGGGIPCISAVNHISVHTEHIIIWNIED